MIMMMIAMMQIVAALFMFKAIIETRYAEQSYKCCYFIILYSIIIFSHIVFIISAAESLTGHSAILSRCTGLLAVGIINECLECFFVICNAEI
jgi:hypothetical protein